MKQTKKRVLAIILSFAMMTISMTFNVKAEEAPPVPPTLEEYGEPISVITYEDEYGNRITESLYSYSPTYARSDSGSQWFRATKEYEWAGKFNKTTYYAEGYFTWGNGEVDVQYERGGYDYIPETQTVVSEETKRGKGKYIGIFNNYASVTYTFTTTSAVGMTPASYSVTVRVSESGNQI